MKLITPAMSRLYHGQGTAQMQAHKDIGYKEALVPLLHRGAWEGPSSGIESDACSARTVNIHPGLSLFMKIFHAVDWEAPVVAVVFMA